MKPSFDTRFLCRCSECDTVFRLAASQLASHAGLVRCGDCGTVFNAAWNLVDDIPNPVDSSTSVAPISSIHHGRDNTLALTTENLDDDPGFATDERLFSLDDQLRQDLQLGAEDPGALEEIRRTLGSTDTVIQTQEHSARASCAIAAGGRTAREYPTFITQRCHFWSKNESCADGLAWCGKCSHTSGEYFYAI